jgi:tetratricopeptide (TPR) repeat protein
MSSCESEVRSGDQRRGIAICRASYERTRDEHHLAWAGQAYMVLDEVDDAEHLAHRLLAGPLAGDGHRILSYVAYRRGLGSAAQMHASVALAIHTFAGDESGMTSDALLLSHAAWKFGDFTVSLGAADEALRLARQLQSRRNEVAAYLARADALRRMGDIRGAAATLASAIERATDPCDKVWAYLKSGMCRMEAGQDDLAMVELTAAAQANGVCRSEEVSSSVAINQAWLLRRKDPSSALARLDDIPPSEQEAVEILLLRSYLAADRGDLAESDRYLARTTALEAPDAD